MLGTAIFIIAIVVLGVLFLDYEKLLKIDWSIEQIQQLVEGFGIFGILIFIFIASIRPFLFFPNVLIFIAGGLIYGTFFGSLFSLIGIMIAATLCYWLGSKFQNIFSKIVGPKYLIRLQSMRDEEIITTLFVMRVTPVIPIDVIGYGAGLVAMPYEKFFIGTLLGFIPKTILYTLLGDAINDIFSMKTMIIFVVLILFAIIPTIFYNKKEI